MQDPVLTLSDECRIILFRKGLDYKTAVDTAMTSIISKGYMHKVLTMLASQSRCSCFDIICNTLNY